MEQLQGLEGLSTLREQVVPAQAALFQPLPGSLALMVEIQGAGQGGGAAE